MTLPRPGDGGSGEGTPGDSRRPAAAWVKACRHLPMFEKLGEAHNLPIIFATKESISYTWKRRGSWGPASPTHADVLATQRDRPHKRRLHTQEPIRDVLKLCEARAPQGRAPRRNMAERA